MLLFFIILGLNGLILGIERYQIIEDFDSQDLVFTSCESFDNQNNWQYDSLVTYNNSPYSLYLKGDNAKQIQIENHQICQGDVWSIASRETQVGYYIAFGIADSLHKLVYAFKGTNLVTAPEWEVDYMGAFPNNNWNLYYLNIAEDWFARYDYYPQIKYLQFYNKGNGKVYFDEVRNCTEDIAKEPVVTFRYSTNQDNSNTINFDSMIQNYNPNETYSYYWQFGDSTFSTEAHPTHTYTDVCHSTYRVVLSVRTDNSKWGRTSENINISSVETIMPITINFVGDVMLARNIGGYIQQGNADHIFDLVHDDLASSDLTVANLESCLTNATISHPTKPIKFKGHPDNAAALVAGGIDIVTLANNHMYDYLYPGILETQQTLTNHNILYSGAGNNEYEASQPLLVNKNGRVLAFLSSSDRNGSYNNYQPYLQSAYNKPGFYNLQPSTLFNQLKDVDNIADFKIVQMHAGSEYSLKPGADYDKQSNNDFFNNPEPDESAPKIDIPHIWDIDLRHYAIDNGADLVIVHHSHIIQGLELYQGKLIAHSLGNFVFDLNRNDTKATMILKTSLNDSGFYSYEVVPAFINTFKPVILKNTAALKILDYLVYRSRELNTVLLVDRENFTAAVCTDTTKIERYDTPSEKIVSFPTNSNTSVPLELKNNGDFVRVGEITPASNYQYRLGRSLIPFGNFENPDFNQWTFSEGVGYDSTTYTSGNHSIKLLPTGSTYKYLSNTFTHRIISAKPLCLYFKYKSQNVLNINAKVLFQNFSNDMILDEFSSDIIPINDFGWKTVCLFLPEYTEYPGFKVEISCNSNNSGEMYIDDCDIIEWDDWITNLSTDQITPNAYYYLQLKNDTNLTNSMLTLYEGRYRPRYPVSNHDQVVSNLISACKNYPNPFNPSTTIAFNLVKDKNVEINIYNLRGQKVKKLLNTKLTKGQHFIQWIGDNQANKRVASGIYFYEIKAGNQKLVNKMLLLK